MPNKQIGTHNGMPLYLSKRQQPYVKDPKTGRTKFVSRSVLKNLKGKKVKKSKNGKKDKKEVMEGAAYRAD